MVPEIGQLALILALLIALVQATLHFHAFSTTQERMFLDDVRLGIALGNCR